MKVSSVDELVRLLGSMVPVKVHWSDAAPARVPDRLTVPYRFGPLVSRLAAAGGAVVVEQSAERMVVQVPDGSQVMLTTDGLDLHAGLAMAAQAIVQWRALHPPGMAKIGSLESLDFDSWQAVDLMLSAAIVGRAALLPFGGFPELTEAERELFDFMVADTGPTAPVTAIRVATHALAAVEVFSSGRPPSSLPAEPPTPEPEGSKVRLQRPGAHARYRRSRGGRGRAGR